MASCRFLFRLLQQFLLAASVSHHLKNSQPGSSSSFRFVANGQNRMTREFKSLHHRARRNVGELSRACKLFDRVLVYAYWLSLLIEIQPGWRRTWRTSLALATLYADKCRRGIQVNCDVWKHAGWLFGIFVKPFFSRLPDQNQNFHDPIPPIVLAHLLVDKGQYPWPKRWSIFKECCIPFFSLMPGRRVGNGKGILLLTISMPNGWHCLATWNPFPSVCFFFVFSGD